MSKLQIQCWTTMFRLLIFIAYMVRALYGAKAMEAGNIQEADSTRSQFERVEKAALQTIINLNNEEEKYKEPRQI